MTAAEPIARATAVVPSQLIFMEELLLFPRPLPSRAQRHRRGLVPTFDGSRRRLPSRNTASGDLLDHVAEHRVARFLVHLGLELVLVLQRDRALRRRTRADLVDHALEVGEFRPAPFA